MTPLAYLRYYQHILINLVIVWLDAFFLNVARCLRFKHTGVVFSSIGKDVIIYQHTTIHFAPPFWEKKTETTSSLNIIVIIISSNIQTRPDLPDVRHDACQLGYKPQTEYDGRFRMSSTWSAPVIRMKQNGKIDSAMSSYLSWGRTCRNYLAKLHDSKTNSPTQGRNQSK